MDHSLRMKNIYRKIKEEGDEKFFWYLGYPCAILRPCSDRKHLCGYVGVPKDHPIYGLPPYIQAFENYFHVHGGLNYYRFDLPPKAYTENPSKDFWFFGFSCTHEGDIVPLNEDCSNCGDEFLERPIRHGDSYKDMKFVEKEVRKLAHQLKQIENELELKLVLFEGD